MSMRRIWPYIDFFEGSELIPSQFALACGCLPGSYVGKTSPHHEYQSGVVLEAQQILCLLEVVSYQSFLPIVLCRVGSTLAYCTINGTSEISLSECLYFSLRLDEVLRGQLIAALMKVLFFPAMNKFVIMQFSFVALV